MSNFKEITVHAKHVVDGRWNILLRAIQMLFGGEVPTDSKVISQIDDVFQKIGIYLEKDDNGGFNLTSVINRDALITFTLNPSNFEFNGYVTTVHISDK